MLRHAHRVIRFYTSERTLLQGDIKTSHFDLREREKDDGMVWYGAYFIASLRSNSVPVLSHVGAGFTQPLKAKFALFSMLCWRRRKTTSKNEITVWPTGSYFCLCLPLRKFCKAVGPPRVQPLFVCAKCEILGAFSPVGKHVGICAVVLKQRELTSTNRHPYSWENIILARHLRSNI